MSFFPLKRGEVDPINAVTLLPSKLEIDSFRVGSHTDMSGESREFTQQDIDDIANTLNAGGAIPCVLGHPSVADPAYGWVESLKSIDGHVVLTLDTGKLAPAFRWLLELGAFRRVSLKLFDRYEQGNPQPGKYSADHLGFLGAAAPAVPGLALAFASASPACQYLCFATDLGVPPMTTPASPAPSPTGDDNPVSPAPVGSTGSTPAPPASPAPATSLPDAGLVAQLQQQITQFGQENQQLRQAFDTLAKRYQSTVDQLATQGIQQRLQTIASKRPALAPHLDKQLAFCVQLSRADAAAGGLAFSVGDKKHSLLESHFELLEAIPEVDLTSPLGGADNPAPASVGNLAFSVPSGMTVSPDRLTISQGIEAVRVEMEKTLGRPVDFGEASIKYAEKV